ncbi:DUF1289 domain-containing protein [Fulvimarina sp. MAC8]|uniref:DUF1289 domain-containing protein n=1 Tax=Fulvimarina sp. MAC8 TaxID=3162874 RepID=UPI0032EEC99B
MIESPCNGICQLHPQTGLCRGCGRTGAEIGAWASLSRSDRKSVMETLPERMRQAGMKPFGIKDRSDA